MENSKNEIGLVWHPKYIVVALLLTNWKISTWSKCHFNMSLQDSASTIYTIGCTSNNTIQVCSFFVFYISPCCGLDSIYLTATSLRQLRYLFLHSVYFTFCFCDTWCCVGHLLLIWYIQKLFSFMQGWREESTKCHYYTWFFAWHYLLEFLFSTQGIAVTDVDRCFLSCMNSGAKYSIRRCCCLQPYHCHRVCTFVALQGLLGFYVDPSQFLGCGS